MKNIHKQIHISLVIYFIVALTITGLETLNKYGCYDTDFLLNRAHNMLECIIDGNYPFFYYNDFGGAGYGSSIFYGQLTLVPFLPFLFVGDKVFLYAYLLVALLLQYFGVCCFSKRFTAHYRGTSLLYLGSTYSVYFICETTLYPNILGVAIGFFFLAFCVDFFRDRKSFISASICFLLLVNTHLITSVICFIGCVFFLLMYFDVKRMKEYLLFALTTVILCLYNILNILYHIDSVRELDDIAFIASTGFSMADNPIRGVLFNTVSGSPRNGLPYMNILMFTVIVLCLSMYKKSKREVVALCIIVISMILGCNHIWAWLLERLPLFIQFPYRYVPFILVGLYLISFRKHSSKLLFKILLLVCTFEVSFGLYFGLCINHDNPNIGEPKDHFNEIGLGEYINSSFDRTFKVYDIMNEKKAYDFSTDTVYDYIQNKDEVIIDLRDNNSDKVTIFKLFYRGYKAYIVSDTKNYDIISEVPISQGISQFIEINTENIDDFVMIRYEQPVWLVLILCIDYLATGVLLIFCRRNKQLQI